MYPNADLVTFTKESLNKTLVFVQSEQLTE